jgi:quercetin dioxygenase-like cupin family protein
MRILPLAGAAAVAVACAHAAERRIDPTFLRRSLSQVAEQATDLGSQGVHYKPVFGAGDPDATIAKGLARYGELTVDPGGATRPVARPAEEQVWVALEGSATLDYGGQSHPLRRGDFLYLAPGVRHGVTNTAAARCRIVIMGFRLREAAPADAPPKLLIANLDQVKKQVVGNHPPSTLYQLMIGDQKSTRDALAAARVLTSLFVMEFAPGGTNAPHHHETEEEAYLVLDGEGEMAAGSGADGVMGRYPTRTGDAWLFRLNCTMGFYGSATGTAHVLAARWLFPFPRR